MTSMISIARKVVSVTEDHHARITCLILLIVLVAGFLYSLKLGDALKFYEEIAYYKLVGNLTHRGMYSYDGSSRRRADTAILAESVRRPMNVPRNEACGWPLDRGKSRVSDSSGAA